jgi:hypothetical protein
MVAALFVVFIRGLILFNPLILHGTPLKVIPRSQASPRRPPEPSASYTLIRLDMTDFYRPVCWSNCLTHVISLYLILLAPIILQNLPLMVGNPHPLCLNP